MCERFWTLPVSNKCLAAVLAAATVTLLAARLALPGDIYVNVWGDRDLWRALSVSYHWPLYGPEMIGGVRAPGGGFYMILAAILAISHDVTVVNAAVFCLFAASVLLIGWYFARRISPLAGVLIAITLAGSVVVNETLWIWNPGFILLFATAVTVFGYSYVATGSPLSLGLATASLAIGMQVHLQITQVALGLILAAITYRPKFTWRHAIAIFLGFTIPYLPNILSGNARLVETAASLPANAVSNYFYWEVNRLWPKMHLFAKLFGGAATEFADRGLWVRIPLMISDLMMLLLAVGAIIATVKSSRKIFNDEPVGFLSLVILVNAGTVLTSDLQVRHMVAAAPAAAALLGLTAERVLARLSRKRPIAPFAAVIFCSLFVFRLVPASVAGFASHQFQIASVAAQTEIAATLKPNFYFDRDAFEAHVAEFTRSGPHHWLVVSNGIPNHMSFLYQTLPVRNTGAGHKGCIAIVIKSNSDGDLRDDLVASPSLAELGVTFGAPVAESDHFLYLPYITRDGNCLKTFPNGYIPTAFEAAYLTANAPAAAKVMQDRAVFVMRRQGDRYPIGIELRYEDSAFVAIMHGRLLRGYTGLHFDSIVAPILCFTSEKEIYPIRFSNVAIGSPQQATLAPWRSPQFSLPDGRYRVWLISSDRGQPIAKLTGDLVVPTMEAAVPPLAALEPPAECFGKDRSAIQK